MTFSLLYALLTVNLRNLATMVHYLTGGKKLVVVLLYELLHLSLSLECLLFFVLSSLSQKEKGYATFTLATTLFLGC